MSKLYAITDSTLMPGDKLITGVRAALEGGCRLVQYRDKSGDAVKRKHEAEALLLLCQEYRAQLIINDDPRLAHETGAHGVHMGQWDGDAAEARRLLGPGALLGITCHDSLYFAEKAVADGASYIAFGRFFPSRTKPEAPPAPLDLISSAKARFPDIPLVAIGGINLENASEVIRSGADFVAVSHALFGAPDIEAQARAFSAL